MRSTIFLLAAVMTAVGVMSCASKPEIFLINSGIQRSKPQDSAESIKGRKVDYELWFNKSKWRILDPDSDIYKELEKQGGKMSETFGDVLVHHSDNVLGLTLENKKPTALKEVARNFNNWTYSKGDQLLSQEIRTINHNEVLFIKTIGRSANATSIKLFYYLTNKTGTAVVYVYKTQLLFARYESDIFNLLNGLVDANSTKTKSDQ